MVPHLPDILKVISLKPMDLVSLDNLITMMVATRERRAKIMRRISEVMNPVGIKQLAILRIPDPRIEFIIFITVAGAD